MNRRNLFKTLTAAIVASSMEVMGWKLHPDHSSQCGEAYVAAEYEGIVWYVDDPSQPPPFHRQPAIPDIDRMPRWDWSGSQWVEVPYYGDEAG